MGNDEVIKEPVHDKYVHGMDWETESVNLDMNNYRKYQFDLIGKHIGKNILEIGTGDKAFTKMIVGNVSGIERLISIEPSGVLQELSKKNSFNFPKYVSFKSDDLFDLTPQTYGLFDTIIMIHVLEHIEEDRKALSHLYSLLSPGGKLLIEVPAMPFLFSIHDEMLGHYRRYNKRNFKAAVDTSLYNTLDLWFQDEIGMLGSFVFFKLKKIKLKSDEGLNLVKNQGGIYNKYIIPFEGFYEKFLRFPFGLSLTAILEKK